jgi:hypothetical protein
MNDNQDIPNPELRSHVSDHSFVLALRKTHIIFLVAVARGERPSFGYHKNDWITPANGLKARGLVLHCVDVFGRSPEGRRQQLFEKEAATAEQSINAYYRLTKAGWAVFDLLVEAGLAESIERRRRKVA